MWLFELFFPQFSATVICRCSDILKYFREFLGIRDNESRLYSFEKNKKQKTKKKQNDLNAHTGSETINYTIVKYGETFYGPHTSSTLAAVKINKF